MTVAHQPLAAFIGALLGVAPEERGHLGLDRLGQKGTGAVAQHLGQRIGKRRNLYTWRTPVLCLAFSLYMG